MQLFSASYTKSNYFMYYTLRLMNRQCLVAKHVIHYTSLPQIFCLVIILLFTTYFPPGLRAVAFIMLVYSNTLRVQF